ncbi:hypothetical protein GCM10029992_40320 [Glycomyces albus]
MVGLGAQADRLVGGGAAQVEVAVAQSHVLGDVDVLVDLERQRGGLGQDGERVGGDLDLAGGELGVLVPGRAAGHDAGDLDAELVAQLVCGLRGLGVPEHDLDDARGVAQIDEFHPAVIAAPRHPSGEGDLLVDVSGTQGAGEVCPIHGLKTPRRICGRLVGCGSMVRERHRSPVSFSRTACTASNRISARPCLGMRRPTLCAPGRLVVSGVTRPSARDGAEAEESDDHVQEAARVGDDRVGLLGGDDVGDAGLGQDAFAGRAGEVRGPFLQLGAAPLSSSQVLEGRPGLRRLMATSPARTASTAAATRRAAMWASA